MFLEKVFLMGNCYVGQDAKNLIYMDSYVIVDVKNRGNHKWILPFFMWI